MFKLIIVDDFFVERENVKDIIDKSGLEIEIAGECSNGSEALLFIEKEAPDFILSDVEMPIMNGLELAKHVRMKYPHIKMIFFSFYNKFEYVKKAIDLEAYAYILKPIVREEMIESLAKIIDERKQEIKRQQEDVELRRLLEQSKPLFIDKFKGELFSGLYKDEAEIWEKIDYFKVSLVKGQYVIIIVEIDDYEKTIGGQDFEKRELFSVRVSRIIKSIAEKFDNCLWMKTDNNHWALLLSKSTNASLQLRIEEQAYSISETLLDSLNSNGISASSGISLTFDNLTAANEMFQQAFYALNFKFNLGKGQIICFEDIQVDPQELSIELNSIQKELRDILTSDKPVKGEQFIEQLFLKINKNTSQYTVKNLCFSVVICMQIVLSDLNISFESIFGKEQLIWEKLMKFETIFDVKQWLINIIAAVVEFLTNKSTNQSKRIIESLKKSINRNYHKAITVKSIADELYYNANYLNNIFKHETGETILEYITKVRIENARKLLMDHPEMKMYEVCQAVGYSHESYFRNIFRQYTGLNPKEFRELKK